MYHWDQFTHPNLYQIDGAHVTFIRLTANVEHTWQTSRDDLVDTVRLLHDRNPQTAITIPYAPYEGLSTTSALRRTNYYDCVQCGKQLHVQWSLSHSSAHWLEQGRPDATKWCFWCGSMDAACNTKVVTGLKKGILVVQSDCPAANTSVQLGRLCKGTRGRPCTNRLVSCPACGKTVFSYVMGQHWAVEHHTNPPPPAFRDYPCKAEV